MAHQEAHPAVSYDPLDNQPNSPRLSSPPQLPPGAETPRPTSAAEFGAPNPGYFNPDTYGNASAASSTGNFRGSNYGSIAPLGARDSTFGYPPGGSPTPGGFKDEEGTFNNQGNLVEKDQLYAAPRTKTKRKLLWIVGALCGVVVLVAIVVPVVYFTAIKKNGSGSGSGNSGSGSSNSGSGNNGNSGSHHSNALTWGGDGSTVTKDDGTTFTYNNSLGGYWVFDTANPLNNSARAQSYTPPLTQDWPWGSQSIYGVNLGGWLVLEPFITPALYEPFYPSATDEWTLSTLIQARDGNLNAIEEHYKTFITEEDFAQIAAAGLNWVRIPLPFWAIEVYPGEPFLAKTSWKYFLKAIEWARKYGLRINVDLHAVPGSQNGWNHSGKGGEVDFLSGVMGIANAQRTMDYIRVIAEFISQPEYQPVVPYFGILNEPLSGNGGFPKAAIREFYAEAYRVIRNAGGIGSGHGPYISIHEAFWGLADWTDFLVGADRLALDHHPYLIFTTLSAQTPESFAPQACANWAGMVTDSMTNFGLTAAGEWSFAINDCGLYVNAVGSGSRYEGTFDGNPRIGSCDPWTDASTWDDSIKTALKSLGTATMDSLGNWFFWTWKIGASSATNRVMSPMWSYQLAVEGGWAPLDPRTSVGACTALGSSGMTFTGPLAANHVGSSTTADPAGLASYAWPPDTIAGFEGAAQAATLPQYTPTGPIPTLPVPTFTASGSLPSNTANLGNGWANADDQTPMSVPISGCTYPDPWNALTAAIPACGVITGNTGTVTNSTT